MKAKTAADWKAEAEAFQAAALREHALVRHWMARATAAENRLQQYDARERPSR